MDAVRDGIAEEMRRDPHIIYFGEGTGDRGGSLRDTKNLFKEFGGGRMIDTPICELGFTGASIGASATGCRAVADLMLADFLFEAGGQIVLQASNLRYMSNGQVSLPMVIRAGVGSVKNAGPHHSGSYYPVWAHCPGLIVVVPSNPADAKGLFKTALRERSRGLPRTEIAPVEQGPGANRRILYSFRSGERRPSRDRFDDRLLRPLVAAIGGGGRQLAAQGISAEVIDLRTIVPLDTATILASVKKTGRLLVVDEAYAMCGVGAEISAIVMEEAFDELDAPVGRLHTEPVSHPFAPILEDTVTASPEKIVAAAKAVIEGRPPHQRRPAGYTSLGSTGILPVSEMHRQDARATSAKQGQDGQAVPTHGQDGRATSAAIVGGVPVIMPNMDLIITEATIVGWFKKIGERVGKGEALLEIETDKAVTLDRIALRRHSRRDFGRQRGRRSVGPATGDHHAMKTHPRIIASPRARRAMQQRGIDAAQIKGTGPNGRIVEADVLRAAAWERRLACRNSRGAGVSPASAAGTAAPQGTISSIAAPWRPKWPRVSPPFPISTFAAKSMPRCWCNCGNGISRHRERLWTYGPA